MRYEQKDITPERVSFQVKDPPPATPSPARVDD
jgi:hypothetical protein